MSALHPGFTQPQTPANPLHSVQLYGADESHLAVSVGRYIAEGLQLGEAVLVIATPKHTDAFIRHLRSMGAEPTRAVDEQRLAFLDAETTLSSFMVEREFDEALFRSAISGALGSLRGGTDQQARRAYGEMVGVLWEHGEIAAALELEELWNRLLATTPRLQLFCGYPIDILGTDCSFPEVEHVVRAHTHLVGTGQHGDMERALQRAINGGAAAASNLKATPALDASAGVVMPKAERAIFALRTATPDQAPAVLERARGYYQTEKRFRALIENSADAILLTDAHGRVLYASSSTSRVLGHSSEQIIGRSCFSLVHPGDRWKARETVSNALADPRRLVWFEARLHRSARRWQWVESTLTNLCDEPAVGGIVWNCRDITERKMSEQALRESERRLAAREQYLETLLESVPECVKVLDKDGNVLQMNSAGLRMLEADSAEQVLGKCVYSLIDECDREAFRSLNESVFGGGSGGALEFSVDCFRGARRTFETHVTPLRDESDRVIGALSATRDITARKAAETALRQANDSLEQFAYAAAHDLQEPIRNIALYTELLAHTWRDRLDDQAKDFMSITVEGARRMQTLIQDLLAYARSLDTPSDQQPGTDARDAAEEVLANLRTAIEASGAEVLCGDLPVLPIYRVHLVQLLQNLISNALKYRSDHRPRIEMTATEDADGHTVRVRDNGVGIPEDQRQRIFGVFKRLHGRSIPGNGIGLAICQRIISHYGGSIWVESGPCEGSTFVFTLPRMYAISASQDARTLLAEAPCSNQ